MRKTAIILLLALIMAVPAGAYCAESELSASFGRLSGTENALRTLSRQIDEAVGAETKPERLYAMQDMAGLCNSSRMQVHSLSSLFSMVNLVKRENVQDKQTSLLKKKCGYAFNDFSRRRAFVLDILQKAKDSRLRDLAKIFDAQLAIAIKELSKINSQMK